jgi:hypothetical protein
MERRAWGAGREYHLIPVRLPQGVFHCKCAYLSSKEGDVLLIGSGNLTFGGYGRNLEALQVLKQEDAPVAFRQFADFLEVLANRDDFSNPEGQWLQDFSARARGAVDAELPQSTEGIRLVHSVYEPVVDQICDALEGVKPIEKMLVLSPYHDPKGHAVKTLADRIHCPRIAIGLPLNPKTPSAFPFPLAKSWKQRILAMRPDAQSPQRRLHAKWFEFAWSGGVATLVGSVNATSQALCTTNNIELGVLRFDLGKKTLGAWEKAEVPDAFQPNEFPSGNRGQTISVYAVLHSDGQLAGQMLTETDCTGIWKTQLEYSGGDSNGFEIPVKKDNRFRMPFPGNLEETLSSTIQLIMRCNCNEARGWVHVEELLGLPERDRRVLTTIGRFVKGNADADDEILLLEYLANSAIRHLNAFDVSLRFEGGSGKGEPKEDEEAAIAIGELKPDPDIPASTGSGGHSDGVPTYVLDKWFAQLRKRLLGPLSKAEVTASLHPLARKPSADSDDEGDDDEGKAAQVESALDKFENRMRHLIEEPEGDAHVRQIVFVMWLEVELNMLAFRIVDLARANFFAKDWFEKATASCGLGTEPSALEQHVFAIAGAMPLLIGEEVPPESTYAGLHEDLERFCCGAVPVERAVQSASQSYDWVARALRKGSEAEIAVSLKHILEARTLRQEVEMVLSCLNSHQPVPADSKLFDTPEGSALREFLMGGSDGHEVLPIDSVEDACPRCQMQATTQAKQKLRTFRVARCPHCNYILLRSGI